MTHKQQHMATKATAPLQIQSALRKSIAVPPQGRKIASFAALTVSCVLVLGSLAQAAPQVIHSQRPATIDKLKPLAYGESSTRLNLVLGLPLRNQAALAQLLHELYDPAHPRYHQYLKPGQFAVLFGPSERDYQEVIRFATSNGLTVTGTHPNRTLLDVTGSVADIEKTFHLQIALYEHPTENRRFYAAETEPSADLAVPLLGVVGLDNFVLPHPMNLNAALSDDAPDPTESSNGSGPAGDFIGNDFRAAYAPGVTLTGAGQSVGLFELDGYYASDIAQYESLARLPNVPLTNIFLDGFNGTPGTHNLEVAVDIDMVLCMAPGLSQIIVYEGSTPDDILNRMATDDAANQLSCSWGFGPQTDALREQIYEQFMAQGQSMLQASGDNGAYPAAVESPSDDPNLTVVGGTLLATFGADGSWASETAWSGSGGGSSTTFAIPPWQQGISMTANHGSTSFRNIPDVAALGGASIWLVAFNGAQGSIGGTSAATPIWAGFTALVNQQAAERNKPPVGFLNPALYAIGQSPSYAGAFHDITSGNNTNSASPFNYFAVPGFDLCTGWGTPTGSNLINALVAPPDALQIMPTMGLTASGGPGGPFNGAAQNVTLTNIGVALLHWTLGNSASWLTLAPANGTLFPDGSAEVLNLRLNSAATNLPPGTYVATLWFTNLSDHFVQSRQVTLDVLAPPVITAEPDNLALPTGATAVFSVGTSNDALLSYQWEYNSSPLTNGGDITGANTSTLTVSNVSAADVGSYSVVVSNVAGVASSYAAMLSIISSSPVILTQPASQTVSLGATASFTVTAAGDPTLLYQWQYDGTNLSDGGGILGSSSSVLNIGNVSAAQAGTYTVVVSNSLGQTSSAPAVLLVASMAAPGVSFTTLYSFTGDSDGGTPNGLMQATNGNYYGTTQTGGINSGGTFFQMTPSGAVSTLAAFNPANSSGYIPSAVLVQGADGNLYGPAAEGGPTGWGTIFKISTSGALSTVFTFLGGNGGGPETPMILGTDGNFYGSTAAGGADGNGELFQLSPAGSLTILAPLTYFNGFDPSKLVQSADGSLYGTTFGGGSNGDGTMFKVTTNGTFTSLLSFSYTNGGFLPLAGLTQVPGGNFYGTTFEGGASGSGTVFMATPSGIVTTLYSFTGGNDGSHPSAELVLAGDGNLYGTTVDGGADGAGTVFRYAPGGALTPLVSFNAYDGANPQTPLIQGSDGNLYGTTLNGGVDGNGVIFRVNINSPLPQITGQPASQSAFIGATAVFSVAVGGNPPLFYQWQKNGVNLFDGGNISGSASRVLTVSNVTGADAADYSVIISNALGSVTSDDVSLAVVVSPPQIVTPPASQTLSTGGSVMFNVAAVGDLLLSYQWQFNGTNLTNGANVSGATTNSLTVSGLSQLSDGTYSVIVSNAVGEASAGALLTIFPVSASGTEITSLHWFSDGDDGGTPNGLTVGSNGLLYGTTQLGGSNRNGTVFSISTNGVFNTLVAFNLSDGSDPLAAVVQGADGNFYGTTENGGTGADGTVFKMSAEGALSTLSVFTNENNINPYTALVQGANGSFYGATENSYTVGDGNIIEIAANGAFEIVYSFTGGLDGNSPVDALTLGADGDFYGMTSGGGAHTNGGIFKMTASGVLTNIYYFTGGSDGFDPAGALVQASDGNFYGVTTYNTFHNFAFYGTIFKVSTNGAFNTLYTLNPFVTGDGSYPLAGLIQAADGNFYGTTSMGGSSGDGTVFRVTSSGTFTTLASFDGSDDGSQPKAALAQGPDGAFYGTTSAGGPYGKGSIFRLAITSAPQITTQPTSQTVFAGSGATFSVAVFGAWPLEFQWQFNGINLIDGNGIFGSTSRILSMPSTTSADAGTYSVVITNTLGSVVSAPAVLTVEMPPVLQSATLSGDLLTFSWNAIPSQPYQVQSTTNLATADWVNLGPSLIATNTTLTVSNVITSGSQQFYRVVLVP